MTLQYEYGFMFHSIDLTHIGDLNSEPEVGLFGQELAELTQGLNETLPNFDGGGWEVVSHNINFKDSAALVSFLIRRPVTIPETSSLNSVGK